MLFQRSGIYKNQSPFNVLVWAHWLQNFICRSSGSLHCLINRGLTIWFKVSCFLKQDRTWLSPLWQFPVGGTVNECLPFFKHHQSKAQTDLTEYLSHGPETFLSDGLFVMFEISFVDKFKSSFFIKHFLFLEMVFGVWQECDWKAASRYSSCITSASQWRWERERPESALTKEGRW